MPRPPKFEGADLSSGQGKEKFLVEHRNLNAVLAIEPETSEGQEMSLEEARELFKDDFYGPEEVKAAGFVPPESIPPIPFTTEQLTYAHERGEQLIFFCKNLKRTPIAGYAPTIPAHIVNMTNHLKNQRGKKFFVDKQYSIGSGAFYNQMTPREGWRLVSRGPLTNALSTTFLKQMENLIGYLKYEKPKHGPIPPEVQKEMDEFRPSLVDEKREQGGMTLVEIHRWLIARKLNAYYRETAVEAAYRLVLTHRAGKASPALALTNSINSFGGFIRVAMHTPTSEITLSATNDLPNVGVEGLFLSRGAES